MSEKSKLEEEINVGSMVTDHAFVPAKKSEPWGLCGCGLGEAAHAETAAPYRPNSVRAAREGKFSEDGPAEYYNQGTTTPEVQDAVQDQSD